MILEEIAVENWRGYLGPHRFQFGEGVNLLVGPNEAGKTTLFEALWRTLFDRHSVTSPPVQALRPVGTSLSPRSSVTFSHDGHRYRVVKHFLDRSRAELYEDRGGTFVLTHEQDKADTAIVEILGSSLPGKGPTKPQHRGLAEALWYLQRESSLPEDKWNDGVRKGLSGIIQLAVQTPEEGAVVQAIRRAYDSTLTDRRGEAKKNTELSEVSGEIQQLEREQATLAGQLHRAETYRTALESLAAEEAEKQRALDEAKALEAQAETGLAGAEVLERRKVELEGSHSQLQQEFKTLTDAKKVISDRQKEAAAMDKKLESWGAQYAEKQAEAQVKAALREEHRKEWKESLEPELKQVETQLKALQSLERTRKLEKQEDELRLYLDRLRKREEELRARRAALIELRAPTDKELRTFQEKKEELTRFEGEATANSIRVAFDLKKGISVKALGEVHSERGEYLVREPTTFRLGGIGEIKVRGGGRSLEELNASISEGRESITTTRTKFGVKTDSELIALSGQRAVLEQEIRLLEEQFKTLQAEHPGAEDEYPKVKRGLAEERAKTQGLAPVDKTSGGAEIRRRQSELQERKERLVADIGERQRLEHAASEAHLRALGDAQSLNTQVETARARKQLLGQENTRALASYGDLDGLDRRLREVQERAETAGKDLSTLLGEYAEKVETPRRLADQAKRAVGQLQKRLVEIVREVSEQRGRIEEVAAGDSYTRLADVEAKLGTLNQRSEVLKGRAVALRLLRDILEACESQRTAAIAAPVGQHVNRWLQELTGGVYDNLSIDDGLRPVAARLRNGGHDLPFSSLSYGTAEQVVVLVRLAMGVLVSREERNLVILDDRLVNADPVRLRKLCLILEEAARNCQILVATCDDGRYMGLPAETIRIPDAGGTVDPAGA